jgi:hypothetical protein
MERPPNRRQFSRPALDRFGRMIQLPTFHLGSVEAVQRPGMLLISPVDPYQGCKLSVILLVHI